MNHYEEEKEAALSMPTETAASHFKQDFKAELASGWSFGPDCSKCGKPSTPITYGLLTHRAFMNPNFYSGGCIIREDNPEWACRACEVEF